ncbi:metal-dependent hydrolase family protein [Halalkalicoccus subterraneus]|uniref:metal-dependent hydrolase family protein n=1 Tax=Halalkalicoccus subterraneus TaxID=2675002 RepID=UPI000EFA8D6A|nr:amidohydrolase family protein [Halalkalicoccus subterraneus]
MILRDARLFDGHEELAADGAIRFDPESERIEAVGDAEPQGEEPEVSIPGHTVLPGLVDAHVHFSLSGQATVEDVVTQTDGELALVEAKNARTTLEAGVTSVRAMGARDLDVVLKRAIDRGDLPGPRTLANCRSITITGGHGHHLGREVDGPTECRTAVREQVKRGAGFIKFMATGGVTTPGTDPKTLAFTHEELEALIDESHRRGVHAATHAHGAEGIKAAAAAGVDTVEHGTFMDEESIDLLLTNDVTLVPTLSAPYRIARNTEQATEESAQKTGSVYERHIESFKRAHEAGVNIAGGTDVGTPFNYHGTNSTEISFMVEHGMSEREAIEAMTASAADVVGLDVGVLEPGKYADLLVVEGDPLKDVSLLREPTAVLKGGEVVAGALPEA